MPVFGRVCGRKTTANMTVEELIQQGIEAVEAGYKAEARRWNVSFRGK
jgi:hypothetical protein